MISGVVCNTAFAQIPSGTGIGVKIDTPVDSTSLPAGDLTIYGTSSDDDTTNCQVYADWNDLKPMQNVSANGPKGISDFSKWSFTYTNNYHNIVQGQNELTSKITCYDSGQNASSKSYSINVTGTQEVSKNSNDTLQQTKGGTVPESNNILSVNSNNNNNNDLNNAVQQNNKENISNTDAESTNVDTATESTNVDASAEATNVDTATEATNTLHVKSNNTDSTSQQTHKDTDNEANPILPVENNNSNNGAHKILPLYSESNEKSTKSFSSEGSDESNLSTGTVESENGYNSKAIDNSKTGTIGTFGSPQEGRTGTNISPMSGSEISEGTDRSGVDSDTNTFFTYEPDLGEDQQSSTNYDQTINTPGSGNSISNLNDEGNSIFGLKFNHLHKSLDTKLEQKIEKLEDKIADRVHLFDLIG